MNRRFRNSQKRIYQKDAIYFITTVTKGRYPFFSPDNPMHKIFCDLFVEELRRAKTFKAFKLFGFTIMYDHIHLLIQPGRNYDISKIMFSIKKQYSHDINRVLGYNEPFPVRDDDEIPEGDKVKLKKREGGNPEGEQTFVRPQGFRMQDYVNKLTKIYTQNGQPVQKFQWQRSFHDRIIRGQKDFYKRLSYIKQNHHKHSLHYKYPDEWEYVYPKKTGKKFNGLFDELSDKQKS